MIDENAFRFVALRPPRLDESRGHAIVHAEVADAVKGRIEARRQDGDDTNWADAASAVGTEIVTRSDYWPRMDAFAELGFDSDEVAALIDAARRAPEDHKGFLARAQRWLDRAAPPRPSLPKWLRQPEFSAIRNNAWTSWYGYALASEREPQDAERMRRSLLLLELLDGAAQGDKPFTRVAAAMVSEGPALRPDVVFGPASEAQSLPGAARRDRVSAVDERLEPWLIDNIRLLEAAQSIVRQYFEGKLNEPRTVQYYVTSSDSAASGGAVGFRGVDERSPWRVTQAELDSNEALSESLLGIGFDPTNHTLPDALNLIGGELAQLTQRLYALRRRLQLSTVDGRQVRVRELAGVPHDSRGAEEQ